VKIGFGDCIYGGVSICRTHSKIQKGGVIFGYSMTQRRKK
jgi:hypothetical protein